MSRAALVLALAACHRVPTPKPLDLGLFRATLDRRPAALEGNAVYGLCLQTAHIFLISNWVPKASLTIHPMGAPAVGRHPFRPLGSIHQDVTIEPSSDGPYSLEVVIPPDTVFEADSGWIDLGFDLENHLRGTLRAWVHREVGGRRTPDLPPSRLLAASFIALRERGLEASLMHGTECARE
jgi:hypothetical protein